MKNYDTVTEAVSDLQKRGYTEDFVPHEKGILHVDKNYSLNPDDFKIDEVHRFEGETDPADETIVYAISSLHDDSRGILVNAYGMYSESWSNEMIAKLKTH